MIITSDDVCCNIRNVKFIKVMHFKQMFVTAVCVLFLLKLKWPKSKNFYETGNLSSRFSPGWGGERGSPARHSTG